LKIFKAQDLSTTGLNKESSTATAKFSLLVVQ
jgi:hypothetical protein